MKLRALAVAAVLLSAHAALAQTQIELSTERLAERPATPKVERSEGAASFFDRFGVKSNEPGTGVWFIPRFQIDQSPGQATTTLWSARNERPGSGSINVQAIYVDQTIEPLLVDEFVLDEDEIATFNLSLFPELVNPGGISTGLVVIFTDGPISVDTFQIDPANNFATGDVAVFGDEFCTNWQVRFLDFGGLSGGSELSFLIDVPQGALPEDPPSIEGEVFDQGGNFLNSFTIRTEFSVLDIPALDLVLGGTKFGAIELRILGNFPGGFVSVRHSAFGLFSVGLTGICRDGLFL